MADFEAHKALGEAQERTEHARHTPRFIPLAAAVVAVIAAVTSLLATQRSTQSIIAKNEAIIAYTRASDAYNYYQAKSIKEELYRATLIAEHRPDPALQVVIDKEHRGKAPKLADARAFEGQAKDKNAESQRFLESYETLEIAVTLFEIAIVMISILALTAAPLVGIAAVIASLAGVGFAIAGLTPHP